MTSPTPILAAAFSASPGTAAALASAAPAVFENYGLAAAEMPAAPADLASALSVPGVLEDPDPGATSDLPAAEVPLTRARETDMPIGRASARARGPATAAEFEQKMARLPAEKADEVTIALFSATRDSTKILRDEQIRQAKITFNAAIALVVIGVLIIFAGGTVILFRPTPTGVTLTAVGGAISEIISLVLFRFHSQTNGKLDALARDLGVIEGARMAMIFIEKIKDPAKRDDAIREAARELRARGNVSAASVET